MLSLMVAVSNNGVIGRNNTLPWKLPKDLPYFKKTTMGKTVVMGRKTYQSIGKPLPGRTNVVLTRAVFHEYPAGVLVANDIKSVITGDAFVIGGAEIYKECLPLADMLYVTKVHADVAGDAYFYYSESDWALTEQHDHYADDANPYDYSFCVYKRK